AALGTRRPDLGVRQWINENPRSGYVGVGILLVIAGGFLVATLPGSTTREPPELSFFTTDDGATFFAAARTNHPPFDHNGKTALGAAVFECGGESFVGYVERYVPAVREELEQRGDRPPDPGLTMRIARGGVEVKRPGDDTWVRNDQGADFDRVVDVRCSETAERAEPIFP
ncbi:MAG: hypothetical protein AAF743_06230, partial [Planctomycetota bacterium]